MTRAERQSLRLKAIKLGGRKLTLPSEIVHFVVSLEESAS
jgi:hypothetical protein